MKTEFTILYSEQAPEERKALRVISAGLTAYTHLCHACLPARELDAELLKQDCLILGTREDNPYVDKLCRDGHLIPDTREEGFTVKLMENPYAEGKSLLAVASQSDPAGVLYGAVELIYGILPEKRNRHSHFPYFYDLFGTDVPAPFELHSAPVCRHRGLWTWGHVIFDYRRYLDRMVSMKMNALVIWNDHPPVNLREVIDYAHACGIRIYLGYAWGWDNKRIHLSKESLRSLREEIAREYRERYACYNADGIYFQSFTETNEESLDGLDIAQEVTSLVNDVSAVLLQENPRLQLLFGLHATSVKNKLDTIRGTDPRVSIIWEDMGAFPYAYVPEKLEDFEQTEDFVDTIATLRGKNERFGAVTKGLICLDWNSFLHQRGPFVMGEASGEYVRRRFESKKSVWKYVNAYWLKNLSYAKKALSSVLNANPNSFLVGLVEDGLIEEALPLPVALYGELLWDPNREEGALLAQCAQRPDVPSLS